LLKRAFDLLLGIVLSLISLPLVIVLAVGSALAFREWPFFSHFRVGQSGELFRFLKIRSLTSSTPRYADKYALREMQIGRWGSFLRRTHLDELPQLWLVLFGKMSLVGPRPEMPELMMSFDCEFVDRRLSVPQGCTGLWQISAGNVGLIGEAPELDDFYVANWTVRMDLWILWRTLLALAGRTVSGPGRVPNWCLRR
jgi:lipopolysaccharide/colanic/teichoic acid biosynthesis glycosyltransferase